MKRGDLIYKVGCDESGNGHHKAGNGRTPETYASIFSNFPHDLIYNIYEEKTRKHHGVKLRLKGREYRFLTVSQCESKVFKEDNKYKKIGVVLASLLYKESLGEHLTIYLDGEWNSKQIDFARNVLRDTTGLARDTIIIINAPRMDLTYPIVHLADETAHWVRTRKRSLVELEQDTNRKMLKLDLL
jgi:hypothetical protein